MAGLQRFLSSETGCPPLIIIIALLVLASCRGGVGGIFYSSSTSHQQTVDLKGIKQISIQCYCPSYAVIREHNRADLLLEIEGNFSISGYHGSRQNAGASRLLPDEIAFTVKTFTKGMILQSREQTYIHHATIIEKLVIRAPTEIMLQVQQLSYEELEGRQLQ